jgi:hypothetical protein
MSSAARVQRSAFGTGDIHGAGEKVGQDGTPHENGYHNRDLGQYRGHLRIMNSERPLLREFRPCGAHSLDILARAGGDRIKAALA